MPEEPEQKEENSLLKSFLEHLEDLRLVLIKIFATISIACILTFCYCREILLIIQYPLLQSGVKDPSTYLKILNPMDPFSISFQISLYAALVVSAPFVVYFISSYLMPALNPKEKKYIVPIFLAGTILFLIGVTFCYFLILPSTLKISREMGLSLLNTQIDSYLLGDYISLVTNFTLAMGLGFELPLVVLFLVMIGILDYPTLAKTRRYAIVIILILAAVLTPTPDVFTQLMMALPLAALYEICIWIAWFMEKKRKPKVELLDETRD